MNFDLSTHGLLRGFFLGLASPAMAIFSLSSRQKIGHLSNPGEQDLMAMRSDWVSLGESFHTAIEQYADSYEYQEKKKYKSGRVRTARQP